MRFASPVLLQLAALALLCLLAPTSGVYAQSAAAPAMWTVEATEVDDLKAVYGTIRSKDRVEARVRTPGTVTRLLVAEGDHVTAGQIIAVVADDKIALRTQALDAQIAALKSAEQKAHTDLERAQTLHKQGITPQANVDQLTTALSAAANATKSALAERDVLVTQVEEGQVKAPANGRVLAVPVTVGSVVMGGETVASIAANDYVLRLELPERQARFIKDGDAIGIGARGLDAGSETVGTGTITLVHPELLAGRVIADAEATGLGDYYVGERALVYISAGKRRTIIIPRSYIVTRAGYDFVRLAGAKDAAPLDVVVQLGRSLDVPGAAPSVEVLTGLEPGDRLVSP